MSKKILLIDNNEFSRLYFRDVFWMHPSDTGEYYTVIPVKNIQEARDVLSKEEISTIIIEPNVSSASSNIKDLNHLDACQFVKSLREDPKNKNITIVAFSDHDNKMLFKEMIKSGADTFLAKGKQTTDGLVSTIDSIIATKEKAL